MSNYDTLFGIVIRLPDENGAGIHKNIDEITNKIGELLKEEFQNFGVWPLGMELVEHDNKCRIVNKIHYTEFDDDPSEESDDI